MQSLPLPHELQVLSVFLLHQDLVKGRLDVGLTGDRMSTEGDKHRYETAQQVVPSFEVGVEAGSDAISGGTVEHDPQLVVAVQSTVR